MSTFGTSGHHDRAEPCPLLGVSGHGDLITSCKSSICKPGLVGTIVARLGNGRRTDSNRMISNSPISGAQLRAARALLKWSVRELSDRCRVSRSAISRSERVDGTLAMQMRNLNAIRRTFEEHGIEFLGLDGVRLLPRSSRD